MAQICIDVPDETLRQLEKRLGREGAKEIANAAFTEWVDWVLARDRPLSISDMETARVIALYKNLFVDTLPSALDLSAKFQLPLARCRYILQSLRYLQPQMLAKRWLQATKDAYSKIEQVGDLHIMDVSQDCKETVDQLLRQVAATNEYAELRGKRRGGVIRYELTSGYFKGLLEVLNAAIEEANREGA